MFSTFGVNFTHSIRRRVIVNTKNACLNKQMRLTNIQYYHKKPTRFTYRIEYTTTQPNGGRNFIAHLLRQG